ncbi:MAG: type II toxin-antitoxin system RelE/ParE family toxin [Acidobacteriia bacterium]|nr:type II toxin-antitoxin system RelE/ParE family toxin [Terriglobia bacterium]
MRLHRRTRHVRGCPTPCPSYLSKRHVAQQVSTPGADRTKADTRELVMTNLPYVVIYRVGENVVEVIRILHGAQDWP